MSKQDFLENLRKGLSGLPREDIEERLMFYSEMIDDRMEEGLPEEDAVSEIGSADEIISQTISDTSITKIAKERIKSKRRLRVWETVLLVLGSPIWLSLMIAAFAVVLSLYIVLWSVVISLWSVFVSLAACSVCGIVAGIAFSIHSNALTGIAMLGAAMVCAGLSVFAFLGCTTATKGILILTKKLANRIKSLIIGKKGS